MKPSSPWSGVASPASRLRARRDQAPRGLTLIEMSVVILALLLLAVILLTGARGWKRSVDRANCIINLNAVQKAVRGFSNMSGLNPGDTVLGLEARVVGPGNFFEALPPCPGGGSYTLGGDKIPELGSVYMKCSLEASLNHVPESPTGW